MVGNCTKGKEKEVKRNSNPGQRRQGTGFMGLLTQVSEDRVQVICKLSTQVNKGRVQVRLEPGSTRTGYTFQQGKPVLRTGKLLLKDFQVLQPGKHGATE